MYVLFAVMLLPYQTLSLYPLQQTLARSLLDVFTDNTSEEKLSFLCRLGAFHRALAQLCAHLIDLDIRPDPWCLPASAVEIDGHAGDGAVAAVV